MYNHNHNNIVTTTVKKGKLDCVWRSFSLSTHTSMVRLDGMIWVFVFRFRWLESKSTKDLKTFKACLVWAKNECILYSFSVFCRTDHWNPCLTLYLYSVFIFSIQEVRIWIQKLNTTFWCFHFLENEYSDIFIKK